MKILIVDNSVDKTGASGALNKKIIEIASKELDFVFVYPLASKNNEVVEEMGFRVYNLRFVEISKNPVNLLLYFPMLLINTIRMTRIVKKEKIDIIHVNDIFNMLGITTKIFTGRKLITHVRRMPESFPRRIYNIWARLHNRYADKILAVSEVNKNALPKNDKTIVLYDPLPDKENLPVFQPRKELNKKLRIVYVANYTEGKGQQYGIAILEKAIREFPDWEFSLNYYGGDFGLEKNKQFRKSLEAIAAKLDILHAINFFDKSNVVEREMKAGDLVFNLSDSESFSRVTLEALFYGLPVLATDVGGTVEMIPPAYRNLLARPRNVEDMYENLKKIILDDNFRYSYSEQAYKYVREMFGYENTSGLLKRVYDAV
jgi:glycosyltransferase involved in cell wall biosynthesis